MNTVELDSMSDGLCYIFVPQKKEQVLLSEEIWAEDPSEHTETFWVVFSLKRRSQTRTCGEELNAQQLECTMKAKPRLSMAGFLSALGV